MGYFLLFYLVHFSCSIFIGWDYSIVIVAVLLQEFATENWLKERERHAVNDKRGQDVWPFVVMMDDSCVMWQNLLKQTSVK